MNGRRRRRRRREGEENFPNLTHFSLKDGAG
jgi:hypothetical protein